MQAKPSQAEHVKKTFSDLLRAVFQKFLERSAKILDSLGITPNFITLLGVLGAVLAAVLIAQGKLLIAGIVAGTASAMDAFDGSLARYQGIKSPFGAFLDSTLDRYSEGILCLGLGYYFYSIQRADMVLWVAAAILGSMLVSYTRARGEAAGYSLHCGLFTRLERTIAFVLSLIFGLVGPGIILIAVLANITALQRIFSVWQQEKKQVREDE
ncbi:MAG: CDP-alcohol phosphatidyltransferase family protein [Anaerolineales bacterium]|nr:CDP-alcohol phosphatidyltransferase family protein [Anaerolineales bacterium]